MLVTSYLKILKRVLYFLKEKMEIKAISSFGDQKIQLKIICIPWKSLYSFKKSCFLVDLRSFLLVFFVWTENKGAFTVTKKLQRLIPVAVLPINYYKFLSDSRDKASFSLSHHILLPSNITAYLCNKQIFMSPFCFLETLHLIALFWIPTVLWQLRKTTNTTEIKLLQEEKTIYKLFIN